MLMMRGGGNKKLALRAAACTALLFLAAIAALNYNAPNKQEESTHHTHYSAHVHMKWSQSTPKSKLVSLMCKHAAYPASCESALESVSLTSPVGVISKAVEAAESRCTEGRRLAANCTTKRGVKYLESLCASDCVELMDDVKSNLQQAFKKLTQLLNSGADTATLSSQLGDVKVGLSSALSFQTACTDNFDVAPGTIQSQIYNDQSHLSELIGNAMSLVDTLAQLGDDAAAWEVSSPSPTSSRRLLQLHKPSDFVEIEDGFPTWVSAAERKLLQTSTSSISANMVVAQDGSGDFTNISTALDSVPSNYSGRYVIYIKAGVYAEVFNVTKDLTDLTFIGDGIGKTIITGNRNVASGLYTTYRSSTVGIAASGFFARDITFRNTAGASGHQAVAVRAGADYMVFYHCSFEGYQDTLYALSSRQFYRECTISGTVDFIFGNAIAVFQNCQLLARLPLQGQQNTYTAQGRKLSSDISGYSFQNCTLAPDSALSAANYTVKTYYGRPWKEYSRVVIMQSDVGSVVDPAGWLPWNSSNPYTDTVYYAEYSNRGAGADTSQRVNWTGVHPSISQSDASQFTVDSFIAGESWISAVGVPYQTGL